MSFAGWLKPLIPLFRTTGHGRKDAHHPKSNSLSSQGLERAGYSHLRNLECQFYLASFLKNKFIPVAQRQRFVTGRTCTESFAPIGRSSIFRFGLRRVSCGVLLKLTWLLSEWEVILTLPFNSFPCINMESACTLLALPFRVAYKRLPTPQWHKKYYV